MKTLTPVLLAFTFALTAAPGPVAGHSSGGWGMHYGGHGGGMMDPDALSDEYLDRIGGMMAERFRSMQQIASEEDPAARRKLLREHFNTMHGRGDSGDTGKQGQRGGGMMGPGMMGYGGGMMGPGMMGPGMMGPGMMGPGMMGPGMMGPGMMGMMHAGRLSDEYLDEIGEHMAEQHARMARIAETSDKAERRKLLREHFEEMREFMEEMHGF